LNSALTTDVPVYIVYVAGWASACLVALRIFLAAPRSYALTQRDYWRFLGRPWKLVTFAAAAAGLVGIAPYTGDPTWDYFDAGFMSVLAFYTAPWAIGTLYRRLRGESSTRQSFVALCVWLFSASWSYDLYLLIRDGYYPLTWWANLGASSVLYLSAGLFWNLDWRPGRGLTFAFTEQSWPSPFGAAPFSRVVWPALLLMTMVSLMITSFLFL
jgi:hypothetical protein